MGKAYLCGTGSGGASGCHDIYVTGPANVTVSAEKGEKKYTRTLDSNGNVLFKNLTPGTWTIKITDGDLVSTETVTIDPEYSSTLKFFSSPITVTYPVGSTCKLYYGSNEISAPDNSGTWTYIARSTGSYIFECTDGTLTADTTVTVTEDEQYFNVDLAYFSAPITITYPVGSDCILRKGSNVFPAPDKSGTWVYIARSTGTYVIECTYGSQSTSKTVEITYDGQEVSENLTYFSATINVTYPAGSICTATDGETKLTAPDTSGSCTFNVDSAGPWTISLDSGLKQTVSFSTSGETLTVNKWYLYNLGNEYELGTGGWSTTGLVTKDSNSIIVGAKEPKASANTDSYAYHSNLIDFTNFTTVKVHFVRYYTNSSYGNGFIYMCDESDEVVATKKVFESSIDKSDQTVSIDVSSLSGKHRVKFHVYINLGRYGYAEFDRVLLS